MSDKNLYDVIILGASAGGSLLAGILARRGMSIAMIDRGAHPRFAIGESSTPAADMILRTIAEKYDLPELLPLTSFGAWQTRYPGILCGSKRGFTYFWHGTKQQFSPGENHEHELLVQANASREQADTHWYRPDVDQFLASVAVKHSAKLFQNADQLTIQHLKKNQWTLTFKQKTAFESMRGQFVVDATGNSGVLLDHLQVPLITGQLQTNSSAIYGHWQNLKSTQTWREQMGPGLQDHPFPCEESAIHHLFCDGWMWQLPFINGLTSLGFLSRGPIDKELTAGTPEQAWNRLLESKPSVEELLASANLAAFPGKVYRSNRLQRLRLYASGTDWAALPSTVGFIDPLHSTGLAHTLSGVVRLSKILLGKFQSERADLLQGYSKALVEELLLIDLLVAGCYVTLDEFQLFTAWSMLYFAAATTFETNYLRSQDFPAGFLCADDVEFVEIIKRLYQELKSVLQAGKEGGRQQIENFISEMKQQLAPYNQVGLFEPEVPNIYKYTSVEKP